MPGDRGVVEGVAGGAHGGQDVGLAAGVERPAQAADRGVDRAQLDVLVLAPDHSIDHLHVTGGHTKNPLLMRLYADATGCTVVQPAEEDAVLLGTAMVAATAAGLLPGLATAAAAMAKDGAVITPDPARRAGYDRDYRIFLAMHEQRRALDGIA